MSCLLQQAVSAAFGRSVVIRHGLKVTREVLRSAQDTKRRSFRATLRTLGFQGLPNHARAADGAGIIVVKDPKNERAAADARR